jgi:hypothetical protein
MESSVNIERRMRIGLQTDYGVAHLMPHLLDIIVGHVVADLIFFRLLPEGQP